MWWLISRGGGGYAGPSFGILPSDRGGEAAVTGFPLFYATALLATARTIATAARYFIGLSQRTYGGKNRGAPLQRSLTSTINQIRFSHATVYAKINHKSAKLNLCDR